VQSCTSCGQPEEDSQIRERKCGSLEDALHERHIDQAELHNKGGRGGEDEHLVLEDTTPKTSILNGGHNIQEDKACEGLQSLGSAFSEEGRLLRRREDEGKRAHHGLLPLRHVRTVRERINIDEESRNNDHRR
jgi:hypothetical protein